MDSTSLVRPLRLIDIRSTLDHRQCGCVYFTIQSTWHVISHSWSADIREFSAIIGGLVAEQSDASYETLFEFAGFGNHPAYIHLLDFLAILHGQRVEWVWLDALCINQIDTSEKDSEIQNMGTYYQKSLGSFVVLHGFGRGFKLVPDDASGEDMRQVLSTLDILPRWYTRAWTFQECVTFIVDLSAEEILRKTACVLHSRKEQDPGASCIFCFMAFQTISPEWLWSTITEDVQGYPPFYRHHVLSLPSLRPGVADNLAFCTTRRCNHFNGVPTKYHWYLADDVGVLSLFKLLYHIKNGFDYRSVELFQDDLTNRVLAKHYVFHSSLSPSDSKYSPIYHASRIMRVLEEISKRDCSNPEDRVLSVLKLLGVEQMLQVRTGRTLQWQLLELGKALLNAREEDTLLKLCVVDPFGSKLPGMSWMADFEVKNGSWQQEAKYMCKWMSRLIIDEEPMYRKARSMKRLGICSETGALEVEAHVCAGSLIFCDHDESMQAYRTKERYYKPKFHGMYTYRTLILHVDGQAVFHLCAYVSEKSTCFLQAVDKYESDAGSYIAFPAPDVHALQQIPVSLVHILNFARQKFLLVCTGDQQSGLHKIGYMVSFRSSWFELNSKLTCCKIG